LFALASTAGSSAVIFFLFIFSATLDLQAYHYSILAIR